MGRAGLLTCASVFIWAGAAVAQDAGRDPASVSLVPNVPLRKGTVDAPPLRLVPLLEVGAIVASNADRARGGTKADAGLRLTPQLQLQSNWSRHEWTANANSKLDYFVGSDDLATSNAHADTQFRLDVRRNTTVTFDAFYDLSANSGDRFLLDQSYGAGGALSHDFGGLATKLRLGLRRENAGEGSDQDYVEPSVSVRGTLSPGGVFSPFIETTYAPRYHDHKRDAAGVLRNSQGGEIAAGVAFDRSPFLNGELAALWQHRNFEDSSLSSINAFGMRGQIAWMPTDFTRLTLGSDVEISESVAGSSRAVRQWSADLGFETSIHDGFTLFADANGLIEDGVSGDEFTIGSDAGLRWMVNPYLGLSLAYENEFSFGGKASDDYSDHRMIASVLLSP